jgi:hypothetical protein
MERTETVNLLSSSDIVKRNQMGEVVRALNLVRSTGSVLELGSY